MSFTSDARLEMARTPIEKRCDAVAELCGAVLASGGVSFRGPGRYGVSIQTESREILERYMALMKRFLGAETAMRTQQTDRLGGQLFYVLSPTDEAVGDVLSTLHLLDMDQPFGIRTAPDSAVLPGDCCWRAFLRGAFMQCGFVSQPNKGYHLEFALPSPALAASVRDGLARHGIAARLSRRKSAHIAYVKDGEAVSDVLALLGAGVAVMDLENVRILKSVRNDVNRQVNCDNNNMDKIVAASEKQISMIRIIQRRLGMDGMPDALREVAELRLQYPDVSLTELGGMLTPPLGKSGVNARMRKLEALAEELVNE